MRVYVSSVRKLCVSLIFFFPTLASLRCTVKKGRVRGQNSEASFLARVFLRGINKRYCRVRQKLQDLRRRQVFS